MATGRSGAGGKNAEMALGIVSEFIGPISKISSVQIWHNNCSGCALWTECESRARTLGT